VEPSRKKKLENPRPDHKKLKKKKKNYQKIKLKGGAKLFQTI
jgi:hypothetical protein